MRSFLVLNSRELSTFKLNYTNFLAKRLILIKLANDKIDFFFPYGVATQAGHGLLIHDVSRSQGRTTVGRTPLDE